MCWLLPAIQRTHSTSSKVVKRQWQKQWSSVCHRRMFSHLPRTLFSLRLLMTIIEWRRPHHIVSMQVITPGPSCHLATFDYGVSIARLQVPCSRHSLSQIFHLEYQMFFRKILVSLGVLVTIVTVQLVLSSDGNNSATKLDICLGMLASLTKLVRSSSFQQSRAVDNIGCRILICWDTINPSKHHSRHTGLVMTAPIGLVSTSQKSGMLDTLPSQEHACLTSSLCDNLN